MQHLLNSDEFAFRYECGFAQPTSTLALKDSERIVTTIAMHYSIVQCMAQLAQLQDGLRSLNVLDMMQANPTVTRPLLIHSPQVLTADHLYDMLSPQLSLVGSNKRDKEEAAYMHWTNLMQLIEGICQNVMLWFLYIYR